MGSAQRILNGTASGFQWCAVFPHEFPVGGFHLSIVAGVFVVWPIKCDAHCMLLLEDLGYITKATHACVMGCGCWSSVLLSINLPPYMATACGCVGCKGANAAPAIHPSALCAWR